MTPNQRADIAIAVGELNTLLNEATPADEMDLAEWQQNRAQKRAEIANSLRRLESELNYLG